MTNLPGTNITQVTVTGTYVDFTGVPMNGTVTFTPTPTAMVDAGSNMTFMPKPVTVPITSGGRIEVVLAATDDPEGNPVGFTYTVTENFTGGRTYAISLPSASSPVDLADISPASSADAGTVVWAGMPPGGTAGQFMVKESATNYDAGWASMADQYLQGTGFPEGVVTAPVGSIYTDTAATNGAIRWMKATGSGSTGWVCVEGDTGARNIGTAAGVAELLEGAWTGDLYIRRTNNTVKVWSTTGTLTNPTGGSSERTIAFMPSGFKSTGGDHMATLISGGVLQPLVVWGYSTRDLRCFTAQAPNATPTFSTVFMCTEPWPTTLPGVAQGAAPWGA